MYLSQQDITGQKFGALTAVKLISTCIKAKKQRCTWLCRCDCGNEKAIYIYHLVKGSIRSCGCRTGTGILKHGHARDHGAYWKGGYSSWIQMNQRCYNPSTKGHENYGGHGIRVCRHWRHSFARFIADMGPRPKGLTLDRIDVNKGYRCPLCLPPKGNCRWATYREQIFNRRNFDAIYAAHSLKMKAHWAALPRKAKQIELARLAEMRIKSIKVRAAKGKK